MFGGLESALARYAPRPELEEVGRVHSLGNGVARVHGLPSAASEEVLLFEGDRCGLVLNLDPDELGVVLLDESQQLAAGSLVRRSGRSLDVPVGPGLLGRVVDPLGRPLDGLGPIQASGRLEVDRPAPPIAARAPVRVPLQTGVKIVDSLFPIGRGQRMLIMGDRQTGKSTLALDTLLNQQGQGVLCVYCFIGQRGAAVAQAVAELRSRGAMAYSIVVVARGEDPPGLHYLAPYAATSLAEYFVEQGQEALVIYDDLTRHARSYREISLLLRRPPGREAFPGDIFYAHSRLLPEWGGGSLTALPIVETEAQNLAAYLPTNLVSITDGQLLLSPELFQKGIMPAVDTGSSVSRVGGDAQLPAYRGLAGELRLSYAQFQELESFSKLASRLDEETRQSLERGRRWRETLKQPEHQGLSAPEQIAILLGVSQGLFDSLDLPLIQERQQQWLVRLREHSPSCLSKLAQGQPLDESLRAELLQVLT